MRLGSAPELQFGCPPHNTFRCSPQQLQLCAPRQASAVSALLYMKTRHGRPHRLPQAPPCSSTVSGRLLGGERWTGMAQVSHPQRLVLLGTAHGTHVWPNVINHTLDMRHSDEHALAAAVVRPSRGQRRCAPFSSSTETAEQWPCTAARWSGVACTVAHHVSASPHVSLLNDVTCNPATEVRSGLQTEPGC